MSRGNGRATIYHDDADYQAFKEMMRQASRRISMRILAWCLMPNHFHFVLRPYRDGDLGRWMHWLLTTQTQRHRRRYETTGRIWQGRFKAPPIQCDRHLLAVMRYVERNPLRAGLVMRAEGWPWSSLRGRTRGADDLIDRSPVPLPDNWSELVNDEPYGEEVEEIRKSLSRGKPYGDPAWTRGTAERLGLLSSLRPRGRPRKGQR